MKKKMWIILFLILMIFEIVKPQSPADYKEILNIQEKV